MSGADGTMQVVRAPAAAGIRPAPVNSDAAPPEFDSSGSYPTRPDLPVHDTYGAQKPGTCSTGKQFLSR